MEGTPFLDGGREGLGVKSVDHYLGSKRAMILGSDQSNSYDGCRHFSIRGYVGEIRRLDRKICWPFAVYDNKDNLDKETERLLPLSVPKFKWWCCQKCSGCTDTCLDDPKGDILEGTCDYNVKACAMHIELKIEHVSVDSREEYSRASNYECGCKNVLPISTTSGIRKDERHEHCVSEKKLESLVSSTTAATAIESVHLSDCFANAEGQEATETRHEEFTNVLGVKASKRKEKTRKKVAKRLVDRKEDEFGQCKPVPDSKSENNLSSKLDFQEFSSRGFDKNSNFGSDIQKSLGHIKCGCDQEKNIELNRKNVPGRGKKNVKIDIDHNKHRDIISCAGHKDDRDAGSVSVVAEICYLNLGSSDCDSSGDDYCLDESKIFSLHNVDRQMQGHLSLENRGSRHSNDQFCLDETACRRTQKTRMLSEIINECDMLAAMERASVSKRIAAMGSLKERIIPVKTSSEGSPTKSHVAPHEEFTESIEMNNKAASHTKVSDSTVGSSQDSLCSSSNKYEERTKVQGCLEVHEKSNNYATEVSGDEQKDSETTIDEIPMDIVELMAKNQHERRLFHAAEHKSMNQLIDTRSKRAPSIMDITAVLKNDVASLLDEDDSFSQNLEYTNARHKMFTDTRDNVFTCARKATETESDQMGLSSVINRTDHMSACKRKLPPSTTDLSREPCFPVSDHYMQNFIQESGWNKKATGCRWFPASIQSAQEYDMLHLAPMQPSMSMHESPVEMQSTQTIKFESHCCSRDSDYPESVVIAKGSGKMIDPGIDMKGMNLRAAPYLQSRKEMVVSETPEKIYPFSWRNNEVDYHPKDMLVSDLYKNEAISAVNLLRLVNRDTLSSASDKSCDESNSCLMNKSQSFHNNQSNASVVPVGCGSNISEISLHPMTPEGCDLNFPLRRISRLLSPLTDVSGGCSLQKDRPLGPDNRKMPFCSMGHFSSKVSLMMHKVMPSYPSPRECCQECFSGSHKSTLIHCFDKKSQCAWDSVNISRHSQKRDQLSPFRPIEICGEKDAKPQFGASDTMMEICILNRNPAEISMYEEEDGSSIVEPEFQKFGKLSLTSNRYWKRQKTVKLAAIKANI